MSDLKQRSQYGNNSEDRQGNLPYQIHSAPLGWKLTTPARKRYVEAAAALAGYDDNEALPMPKKLSELAATLNLPKEFDGRLRRGLTGPRPGVKMR